jgi:cysteine-rich repeat protein
MTISKLFTKSMLSSLFLSVALGFTACGQNNPNETPECGNGTIEDGEQCDDGDGLSGDGCSSDCEIEEDECGDGTLSAGEQCDDGNNSNGDGCSSVCTDEGLSEAEQINAYILGIGELPPVQAGTVPDGPPVPFNSDNDNYECTSQSVTKTEPVSELSVLQDGTTFIFPGAILRGDSLQGGGLTEAAFNRKPLRYSLSVLDGASAPRSVVMDNPNLSAFRDTIGIVLEQANLGNVATSSNVNIREVKSETDVDLAVGVNVTGPQFDVKGSFDFNDQKIRSHFLITIDTQFFTADADAIINPSDIFADDVSLAEVQQKFSDGNPPVYVSSITYGTRIYLAIDSQFDSTEMNAALQATFKNGPITVDGSVSLDFKQVLQSSTFKLISVGASNETTTALTAAIASVDPIQAVKDFLKDATLFNANTIGKPLSFQLKYLADNQPAAFGFTGTFDLVSCLRISQNIRVTLNSIFGSNIQDIGNNLEIYGTVQVKSLDSGASSGNILNISSNAPKVLGSGDDGIIDLGGIQNQVILKIKPEEAKNLRLTFNLNDEDAGADDDLLNLETFDVLFSDGFNRTETLDFGTPSGDLRFEINYTPVF